MTNNIDKTRKVAVIGTGTMGRGIVQVFAHSGFEVCMHDSAPEAVERASQTIKRGLDRLVSKGKTSADAAAATVERIHPVGKLPDIAGAQLVVEAVTEQVEIKTDVLRAVERVLGDDAILASNTSSISITRLAAQTARPQRFIGMHFFNPVPVMKLVEIVVGLETDEATFAHTRALAQAVGKTPLRVVDHPGFVSNRVLMPLINEAIACLQDGVADAETIDSVMQLGCAHTMGPLHTADLIGLDVCLDIMEVLHRDLGEDRYRPSPLLRKMVAGGRLGRKSRRGFFPYE